MLFTLSQTVNTLVIIASTANAIFVHYFPTRSFEIISFLNGMHISTWRGARAAAASSKVRALATWQSISILFCVELLFLLYACIWIFVPAAALSCIILRHSTATYSDGICSSLSSPSSRPYVRCVGRVCVCVCVQLAIFVVAGVPEIVDENHK